MPLPLTSLPLLNMSVLHASEGDYESTSPYPPSSPSSTSDHETPFPSTNYGLRASIATTSDSKLRAIVLKLVDSNPRFQRAIMKELAMGDSPPNTPTTARPHKSRRSKGRRNCKNLSVSTQDAQYKQKSVKASHDPFPDEEVVYHPGHLEEEVYEFVSGSPKEVSFKVVRTITMWSCCDEDEWSPGCVVAPSSAILAHASTPFEDALDFSYADTLPDSDLEVHSCTPSSRDSSSWRRHHS